MNTPEQMRADPTDPRHGTENGYSNLKCRCKRCRKAWANSMREAREARKIRGEIPEHVHGTENGYTNYRCDCGRCKAAWSRAANARRKARNARRKAAEAAEKTGSQNSLVSNL